MPHRAVIRASLENRGALIQVRNLEETCSIATRIAPEYLELSLDDYCAGPKHLLPPSGSACVGVYDFQKRSSLIRVSQAGSRRLDRIENVPGCKTDVADAQWLATWARAGLLRASFIPPANIRHLRLIARQRQKPGGMPTSEKNLLHKVLADAGIRLNVRVSDIYGHAGCTMVKALIEGKPVNEVLNLAGCLRASRELLFDALQPEELSGPHVFVLKEIMAHIKELEVRMGRFEQVLIQGIDAWRPQLILLQTLPGIDLMGAAMLLVEIGTDITGSIFLS